MRSAFEHLWRARLGRALPSRCSPLFAAGVSMSPEGSEEHRERSWAAQGVAIGLVVGKADRDPAGHPAAVKLTKANLDPTVKWLTSFAVTVVAGVGFIRLSR